MTAFLWITLSRAGWSRDLAIDNPVGKLWLEGADACAAPVDKRHGYPQGDLSPWFGRACQQASTAVVHNAQSPVTQGFSRNRRWCEGVLLSRSAVIGPVRLPSPVWISEGGQARIQPVFAGSPQRHFADRFHQATQAVQACSRGI